MPRVSVIVPSYNHGRFLRRRLDSILAQTYQDFELLFLDDASPDDSLAVFAAYQDHPKIRAILNTVNSGNTFKQWNKGAREAVGEYLWFAESDDSCEPTFLERLVSVLDGNPNVSFAYCHSWLVGEDGSPVGDLSDWLDPVCPEHWKADYQIEGLEECRRYLVVRNSVPNASAVLIRRRAYEAIGGADEDMRLCGDWATWVKLAMVGQVAFVAEPLNHFRYVHKDSVRHRTSNLELPLIERLEIIRRIDIGAGLNSEQRAKVYEDVCRQLVGMAERDERPLTAYTEVLKQAAKFDEGLFHGMLSAILTQASMGVRKANQSYTWLNSRIDATDVARREICEWLTRVEQHSNSELSSLWTTLHSGLNDIHARITETAERHDKAVQWALDTATWRTESGLAAAQGKLDEAFAYLSARLEEVAAQTKQLESRQSEMAPVVQFWDRLLFPVGGRWRQLLGKLRRLKARWL